MELSVEQQIFEQIKKGNKILILLPQNLSPDSLSSGLALRLFLDKLKKDVSVTSSGQPPQILGFLPGAGLLQSDIPVNKSLVVSVDTSVKKLEELSYQTAAEKVNIYLKSKEAEFTPQDISFTQEKFPVDLIIALGAKSLEDFGRLYENHADLFFETPKINIDNDPANEYFGAINLVDVTSTSVAEILAGLLQKYEEQLVDEDIATCLLAGIIERTASFQHIKTTPRAFLHASELISLGGRQQEIIKNVFKTKSLPLLKLWGRALARMKIDEQKKAVYSSLSFADFERAEAGVDELPLALKEFMDNLSGYNILALLAEPQKGQLRLILAAHEQVDIALLAKELGESGRVSQTIHGNYKHLEQDFSGMSLEALEQNFIQALKALPA